VRQRDQWEHRSNHSKSFR